MVVFVIYIVSLNLDSVPASQGIEVLLNFRSCKYSVKGPKTGYLPVPKS